MNYHDITKDDLRNGDGLRVVLWVSGCNHYCEGCQNPITWDPNDGLPFDTIAETELFEALDKDYISGLTLSGGDPMYPQNRSRIHQLLKHFRWKFGNKKTVWLYTGYLLEEIIDEPLLEYVDVVVDGPFLKELADVNYHWGGSRNQKVWRRTEGGWECE